MVHCTIPSLCCKGRHGRIAATQFGTMHQFYTRSGSISIPLHSYSDLCKVRKSTLARLSMNHSQVDIDLVTQVNLSGCKYSHALEYWLGKSNKAPVSLCLSVGFSMDMLAFAWIFTTPISHGSNWDGRIEASIPRPQECWCPQSSSIYLVRLRATENLDWKLYPHPNLPHYPPIQ